MLTQRGDRGRRQRLPPLDVIRREKLQRIATRRIEVGERIWLVTFMRYDLGYFDDETCRLEPIENPFAPKLLPMSPE
ncbi:MAG TPA: hypothetical protein VH740_22155 [Vicinamibacterales bacterium]|jgi:hypothetical protein